MYRTSTFAPVGALETNDAAHVLKLLPQTIVEVCGESSASGASLIKGYSGRRRRTGCQSYGGHEGDGEEVSRRDAIGAAVAAATAAALSWSEVVGAELNVVDQGTVKGDGKSEGGFGTKVYTREAYDRFSKGYDALDGGWAASALGVKEMRLALLSRASGRVLEVGVGTGLNLPLYPHGGTITSIDAIDLSPGMLEQASARGDSVGMGGLVHYHEMDVEALRFPSGSFDTVVDTFSLCVFNNPVKSLREMARVCKPGGKVLLLENSKSSFAPLAAYQDLTASAVASAGKGCFWNQDVDSLARDGGLQVIQSSAALSGGLFRALECTPALPAGIVTPGHDRSMEH
ncbi:unnamed protein product [Discosporangium mesarthrocarpum]